MDFDKTDFGAVLIHLIDDFLSGFVNGTHGDDDLFGILGTIVDEWSIGTAG